MTIIATTCRFTFSFGGAVSGTTGFSEITIPPSDGMDTSDVGDGERVRIDTDAGSERCEEVRDRVTAEPIEAPPSVVLWRRRRGSGSINVKGMKM
jgi:hypothetical protein